VRNDLERELQAFRPETEFEVYGIFPPSRFDPYFFTDRKDELHKLEAAMTDEEACIGISGLTGIGKTTLIQHLFWLLKDQLYDPIWLRVDDLFGREPAGHLRIDATRWNKETLLAKLTELQKQRPRSVLVFDNVQAAPHIIRWLADRLGHTRAR
jgi:hypothetical protein